MNLDTFANDLLAKSSAGNLDELYIALAPANQPSAKLVAPANKSFLIRDGKTFFQTHLDAIRKAYCGNSVVQKLIGDKDFSQAAQMLLPMLGAFSDTQAIALCVLLLQMGTRSICGNSE